MLIAIMGENSSHFAMSSFTGMEEYLTDMMTILLFSPEIL